MALHQENEGLNEENKSLQSKVSQLHEERQSSQEMAHQQLQELETDLKKEIFNKDCHLKQLEEHIKNLQKEKKSLTRNLRASGRDNASLKEQLQANAQVA